MKIFAIRGATSANSCQVVMRATLGPNPDTSCQG
jgi:hypothetical protein